MSETPEMTEALAPLRAALQEGVEVAEPGGEWLCIAFMGHNEYTGYVTEIVKNGQPAYRVEMAEKLWGGDPLACVEYAATAWFSARPVTEAWVRKAYERQVQRAAELARQDAEWQRAREQRALTAGSDDDEYAGGPF
jgi:hypothetical protein